MTTAIGVVITEHIVSGRLEDQQLAGKLLRYPGDLNRRGPSRRTRWRRFPAANWLRFSPAHIETLAGSGEDASRRHRRGGSRRLCGQAWSRSRRTTADQGHAAGKEKLAKALAEHGITAPVHIANDADAIAAGVAATRGRLNKLTRVWTIGNGIGYGRWPYVEGVWEGGHITVTLDPKERYCGCGGVGHLEGIMGYRAMRMRFLDLEPEEVFANAKQGDARCREFVDLWHRALAAATASFIHLAGPGRFYFTGHNVGFLELPLLRSHLETMVKMSPLQSFSLEILPPTTKPRSSARA